MIVNTTMNQSGLMDPPQCENFYLKRKLGQDDQNENGQSYVQPKKRHIQNFSTNNLFNVETNCNDINFNLNNNTFINDLFNYDQTLSPVVQTTSVFATDNFDPNWHNTAELLELDQKYNSTIISTQNTYDQMQNQITEIHHHETIQQIAQMTNVCVDQTPSNISYEKSNQVVNNISNNNNNNSNNNNNNNNNNNSNNNNNPNNCNININNSNNSNTRKSAGNRGQTKNSDKIFNSFNNLENETNDFEDKNLSWLFNFKLDELPHLSPEVHNRSNQNQNHNHNHKSNQHQLLSTSSSSSSTSSSPNSNNNKSPKTQSRTGKRFEELVMEVISPDIDANDMIVGENVIVENTPRMPKKPPFTYTELIEYALEDKGELTVSGIYQWISDRFPFYKSNDDRWKNSVRHNLSINPHFRKGVKAPQGAGHLWTISSGDSEENVLAWEHKKQRLELFFKMESIHREKDTSNKESTLFDEAATAAATITQEMHNNHSSEANSQLSSSIQDVGNNNDMPLINDLINDDDLRRSAGEILNGIRRDVEVQAINSIINTYQDSLLDSEDYLNPINKDIAINESGLRNDSSYYVTEIDPIELGINMGNVEEEVLFSDEFNLNYFGITAGNDIVA